jgi:hypothetical protein
MDFEHGMYGFDQVRDFIAIGDRALSAQSQANVLNELRDVQDACFLPLASC